VGQAKESEHMGMELSGARSKSALSEVRWSFNGEKEQAPD